VGLTAGLEDPAADEAIGNLMRLMRLLNGLSGSPVDITAEAIAELNDQSGLTFNNPRNLDEDEQAAFVSSLVMLQPSEVLHSLVNWLNITPPIQGTSDDKSNL
jgi:hypothetical protein